jgi:Reverse transcriptase (RNA-dependent DNA polymerase).
MNHRKKYPLHQCALYKCRSPMMLEKRLKTEKGVLDDISKIIVYNNFSIEKNSMGEMRSIQSPNRNLKPIQKRILKLLEKIERPDWLISGQKGKCFIDNGKAHLNAKYALTVDIKSFYGNCFREYVYTFFYRRLQMDGDVAGIITDIVTYQNGIPTGTPTSQMIAYYAYEDMFNEISQVANRYNCTFTLYVDDMSFSSIEYFKHKSLTSEVDIILRKYGHKLKPSKIKFYGKKKSKIITGTVVTKNNTLKVPNKNQKKIYDNFQEIKVLNRITKNDQQELKLYKTLRGQLTSAQGIENSIFPEINRIVTSIKVDEKSSKKVKRKHHYKSDN